MVESEQFAFLVFFAGSTFLEYYYRATLRAYLFGAGGLSRQVIRRDHWIATHGPVLMTIIVLLNLFTPIIFSMLHVHVDGRHFAGASADAPPDLVAPLISAEHPDL